MSCKYEGCSLKNELFSKYCHYHELMHVGDLIQSLRTQLAEAKEGAQIMQKWWDEIHKSPSPMCGGQMLYPSPFDSILDLKEEVAFVRAQLAEVTKQRDAERATVDFYADRDSWIMGTSPTLDASWKDVINALDCNDEIGWLYAGGKRAREAQAKRVSDEISNIRGK